MNTSVCAVISNVARSIFKYCLNHWGNLRLAAACLPLLHMYDQYGNNGIEQSSSNQAITDLFNAVTLSNDKQLLGNRMN